MVPCFVFRIRMVPVKYWGSKLYGGKSSTSFEDLIPRRRLFASSFSCKLGSFKFPLANHTQLHEEEEESFKWMRERERESSTYWPRVIKQTSTVHFSFFKSLLIFIISGKKRQRFNYVRPFPLFIFHSF